MSTMTSKCPCCCTIAETLPSPDYMRCMCCGHRWRLPVRQGEDSLRYYEALSGRNDLQAPWFKKKIADRFAAVLLELTEEVWRVLEVGCAEGELGHAIKEHVAIIYDGVELSRDSELAAQKLDRVFQAPASQIDSSAYDLIISFHVLEHIAQPEQEIESWSRLLTKTGRFLIEVPNRSGHPFINEDYNFEHLHQFTPASLTVLFERCGYDCCGLSIGHYESPAYPDSIRFVARRKISSCDQRRLLLQHINDFVGGAFIAYGIGGDFFNYLAPIIDELDIKALLDSSPNKWGQSFGKYVVGAYDPFQHGGLPILICSVKYGASIKKHLLSLGVSAQRIVSLEDVYEC